MDIYTGKASIAPSVFLQQHRNQLSDESMFPKTSWLHRLHSRFRRVEESERADRWRSGRGRRQGPASAASEATQEDQTWMN